MELRHFLETALHEPTMLYEEKFVFYLRGAEQAPLFYTAFAQHISKQRAYTTNNSNNNISIDLRAYTEEAQVDALLDISFLGQASLYVLHYLTSAASSIQKYLSLRLSAYSGPHSIIVDGELSLGRNSISILELELDKQVTIDYTLYLLLFSFLTGKPPVDKDFASKIFEQYKQISLENACMIIRYHALLGRHTEEFTQSWLTRLIATDHSLFLLSQLFFAKNAQAFGSKWEQVKALYPDEFWTAFWSEQLWQAAFFIKEAQSSSPLLARKRINRLPFSFTNKDWQRYNFSELVNAHDFLYTNDYNLKNGSGAFGLDLFFAKFLNSFFKN